MILPAHTSRQLRNASLSALYRVAYDHDVDFSDVMASITPSQPIPRAPAARTYPPVPVAVRAEETPSSSADHSAAPAIDPDKPTEPQAKHAAEGALSSEPGGVQDRCESTPPTPLKPARGRPDTTRAKIVAVHAEHPEWPSKLIAEHLGISEDTVRATASRKGLKLVSWWDYQRTLPPEQRTAPAKPWSANPTPTKRDLVRDAHAAHPDFTAKELAAHLGMDELNLRAVASQVGVKLPRASTKAEPAAAPATEALKATPAEPQEPVERAGPPTPRPEPKQPPATTPAEPFDDDEPAPRVRKVMKAPTGRFYLRDKVTGHFVHQSLQPASTGKGPLMTSDRKWAWYDTMERYRGAKKLWPELADMRKEAAAS